MLLDLLLPAVPGLQLETYTAGAEGITLMLQTSHLTAACPLCQQASNRVHSHYERTEKNHQPLFLNYQHHKLTKEGIAYILAKYAESARKSSIIVPVKVKPHIIRHSKAMHLLQAGVNLIYIRDFLGHVDIKTTEIYARADTETKRNAIEQAYPDLIDSNLPDWNKDQELLAWLSNLK